MKYATIRHKLKDCDLLLWRTNSILGRAIRYFGHLEYNHASLVVVSLKYGIRRVLLYEALAQGVEPTFMSVRLMKAKGQCYWFPLSEKWDYLRGKYYQHANRLGGTPYDYKSVLENIAGYVSADAQRLFCSEYLFVAGRDAGFPTMGVTAAPRPDGLLSFGWWSPVPTLIIA